MLPLRFTKFGKYLTNNDVPRNREHRQNENMDLGFENPADNLVNSVNSEFMPEATNARLIMRILNGLSSQKLIQGDYQFNRMLIRERIMPFVNRVYDSNKNKEYSRGTIFALLALRAAIPNFEELITPQINNNNGVLAKFEKIMQKANQKYIDEWNDITNKIVISNFGFGQQYDLSEIREKCRQIRSSIGPLTTVKPNQIKRRNQPHLPKIVEEHPEYKYDEFSDDDGEFKEN